MKAFDTIRQLLIQTSSRDFEKLCHQLLDYFHPTIELSEDMQAFDRAGFDLAIRSADDLYNIETVFQCKTAQDGFSALHLKRSLSSIKAFRNSGYCVDTYYFIINKPLRDRALRSELANNLNELKKEQRIKNYDILDVDDFIQYLLKCAAKELATRINNNGPLFYERYTIDESTQFYIENIPFRTNTRYNSNPVKYLLGQFDYLLQPPVTKRGDYFFLQSEFGFGKTTLLLEFSRRIDQLQDGRGCIFIPVTMLEPEAFANEDNFIDAVIAVLSPFKPKTELIALLNREVMRTFLKGEADLILLIDGLDEHKYFKDFTGLKKLFNSIKGITAPIVFSMRSEYFKERVVDLRAAMKGDIGKVRQLTLTDWEDEQILDFLQTYKTQNKLRKKQASLLSGFASMIKEGKYRLQLGDIPKRPLFLTMVLADVVNGTLKNRKITLAQLYEKYILLKIQRDIEGSFDNTAPDRGVDITGGIIDFSHAVFEVLQRITIYMYYETNKQFALSNSVSSDWIKQLIRDTPFKNVLDFSLHSVIIPADEKYGLETHMKFAHFSFLEFFFAHNLVLNLSDDDYYLELAVDETVFKFAHEIAQKKWTPANWMSFKAKKFHNKKSIGYRLQKAVVH